MLKYHLNKTSQRPNIYLFSVCHTIEAKLTLTDNSHIDGNVYFVIVFAQRVKHFSMRNFFLIFDGEKIRNVFLFFIFLLFNVFIFYDVFSRFFAVINELQR